jgi:NADH-quinone oxidoreductase subunit L
MLFTAFLTAYYTFRLYFQVFEGPLVIPPPPEGGHGGHGASDHADAHATASASAVQAGDTAESGVDEHLATHAHQEHEHNHEPAIMIVPLIVLAIGALFAGYLNWPERENSLGGFLGNSPSIQLAYQTADKTYLNPAEPVAAMPFGQFAAAAHQEEANRDWAEHQNATHFYLMFISGALSAAGIGLAYFFHLKDRRAGEELPEKMPLLSRLLEAKYWVDEIYQAAIVEPLRALGRGFFWVDRVIVDGIIWLVSFIPQASGWVLKLTTERGYLQGYAATMLFGIAVILLVIFW